MQKILTAEYWPADDDDDAVHDHDGDLCRLRIGNYWQLTSAYTDEDHDDDDDDYDYADDDDDVDKNDGDDDDDDDDDLCLIGIGNYWQVTSAQSTNNNLQQTTYCQLIVGYDNWYYDDDIEDNDDDHDDHDHDHGDVVFHDCHMSLFL